MDRHAIIWFRNDLRLHDNEALFDAVVSGYDIIPVYVFDVRLFEGVSKHGLPKISSKRTQFIIDSVIDLRQSLRALGGDLIIRVGIPEDEIYKIGRIAKSSAVFCNRERTSEEILVQDALEKKLWSVGQEIRYYRGKMLFYTQDLPFPVLHTPDSLKSFRLEVERFVKVRQPLKFDDQAVKFGYGQIELGNMPTTKELLGERARDVKLEFEGGETNGLIVLDKFIKDYDPKDKRDLSYSGIAPYLSLGCLSPKTVYYKAIEKAPVTQGKLTKNKLLEDLIIRDFYRLLGKKYKNKIFKIGGVSDKEVAFESNEEGFQNWIDGQTNDEIVNEIMKDLKVKGYLANLDRQIVALYLIEHLKINWQLGAEYFESILIDYDPCSNWLNWNWIAGLTKDTKSIYFSATKNKKMLLQTTID